MKSKFALVFIILFTYLSAFSIDQIVLPDSINTKISTLDNDDKINYLADLCWSNRVNKPEFAVNIGCFALQLAKENNLIDKTPTLKNYIGSIYLNYLQDIASAFPHFQEARDLSIELNDSIQLGFAYNNLGDLYYLHNNLPLAINYAQKANETFERLNFKSGLVYSLRNLGEAHFAIKDYVKALEFNKELFMVETELKNRSGIANSLIEIGRAQFFQNRRDTAFKYFNDALVLSRKLKNTSLIARCFNEIAKVYIFDENYTKALEYTEKAIALNLDSDYLPGIINNQLSIAILLSFNNQKKAGEEILNQTIKLSNDLGFRSYILKSYHSKAEFYTNLCEFELALKSYEEYISIYDSLYSIQSFDALTEMQKSLNAQLTIEKINRDLESKKKERVYVYIILLLLFILGLISYWRFRSISKLNIQLLETNNTKDKLFSIISHDLKAPFNALLGFIELLKEDLENKNYVNAIKFSTIIHKTSNETFTLITNLLNWSITQRDELKLRIEPFEISELIDDIISFNTPQAQLKNIRFINTNLKKEKVLADRNSIHTVLTNLVTNAIKFTGENGHITFKTKIKESNLEINIIDNGVGIDAEAIKNLFDIKNCISTHGTNNEKGTGLGLIICKEFIEKNGGRLEVQSEPGKGSNFMLTLPRP